MSWAISTHNVQSLGSYEEAAKFWTDSKPFKNDESAVPLDKRTMFHKRLVKNAEGGYECMLYNTAMVTYYSDQVHLRCDDRQSSLAFSSRVGPGRRAYPISAAGLMFWKVDFADAFRYFREGRESLKFRCVPGQDWELLSTPAVITERKVDRSLIRPVQEAIKPYAQWHAITKRLGGAVASPFRHADVYKAHGFIDQMMTGKQPNPREIAHYVGAPETLRKIAYRHLNVLVDLPVPNTRLPRRIA